LRSRGYFILPKIDDHPTMLIRHLISIIAVASIASASSHAGGAPETPLFSVDAGEFRVVTVAAGLDHPWGLAFLPDGRALVTERTGRLRVLGTDGRLSSPLRGVPAVSIINRGGLLDVALDPDYKDNQRIYLSYSEARSEKTSGTTVARARLVESDLRDLEVIFRQLPAVDSEAGHFGSRLVFARDGRLFVALGERQARHFSELAQDLGTHFGKVVRLERDGRIPFDNPFVGLEGALPEIWSLGHRNPQGAVLHPQTGELWITEHGPRGGDELNIARAGRNYGWPVITYGLAYSGAKIGEGSRKAGLEQPVWYWLPSIAPSGLAFYTSDRIPAWTGNLFAGALRGTHLSRLVLDGDRVIHEERLLEGLKARIRDVRQGPDGLLYLLTDSTDGRILRIEPVSAEAPPETRPATP
jgi:glucose/arabinose dehydrogenase